MRLLPAIHSQSTAKKQVHLLSLWTFGDSDESGMGVRTKAIPSVSGPSEIMLRCIKGIVATAGVD